MSARATDPWATANSLRDLASATVDFLEGRLQETPSHGGPPSAETDDLGPALVQMNQSGFITMDSQPGCRDVASGDMQRAYVTGICDDEAAGVLERGVSLTELVAVRFDPAAIEACSSIPVTLESWEPFTFLGRWGAEELDRYRNDNTSLHEALDSVYYFQIFDPMWGRNDLLWSWVNKVLQTLDR
ncbi:MAG: DUF6919 domain-containing protein [Yaniella sp.]|uniref:DUF6919 domain-containing protein n=1 Tax=Yaniella sp. TaxID=2773929 RepID=UPI003F9A7316